MSRPPSARITRRRLRAAALCLGLLAHLAATATAGELIYCIGADGHTGFERRNGFATSDPACCPGDAPATHVSPDKPKTADNPHATLDPLRRGGTPAVQTAVAAFGSGGNGCDDDCVDMPLDGEPTLAGADKTQRPLAAPPALAVAIVAAPPACIRCRSTGHAPVAALGNTSRLRRSVVLLC